MHEIRHAESESAVEVCVYWLCEISDQRMIYTESPTQQSLKNGRQKKPNVHRAMTKELKPAETESQILPFP